MSGKQETALQMIEILPSAGNKEMWHIPWGSYWVSVLTCQASKFPVTVPREADLAFGTWEEGSFAWKANGPTLVLLDGRVGKRAEFYLCGIKRNVLSGVVRAFPGLRLEEWWNHHWAGTVSVSVEEREVQMLRERWGLAAPEFLFPWPLSVTRGLWFQFRIREEEVGSW